MRIAFISDLHSCLKALDDVLLDCEKRGVDKIYCLGDVIDMGPEPEQVVARLRDLNIPTIRGNHDSLDESPEIPLLRDIEDWTRERLTKDAYEWLQSLPTSIIEEVDQLRLLMVHGSPDSITEGLLAETPSKKINAWLEQHDADIILAGHTHVPLVRHLRAGIAVNTGSTSIPFEEADVIPPIGLPFSDYAIVDIRDSTPSIEQIRIPFNFKALETAVEEAGMPHAEAFMGTWRR